MRRPLESVKGRIVLQVLSSNVAPERTSCANWISDAHILAVFILPSLGENTGSKPCWRRLAAAAKDEDGIPGTLDPGRLERDKLEPSARQETLEAENHEASAVQLGSSS